MHLIVTGVARDGRAAEILNDAAFNDVTGFALVQFLRRLNRAFDGNATFATGYVRAPKEGFTACITRAYQSIDATSSIVMSEKTTAFEEGLSSVEREAMGPVAIALEVDDHKNLAPLFMALQGKRPRSIKFAFNPMPPVEI